MLRQAVYEIPGPVAVRYPRGGEEADFITDYNGEKSVCLKKGSDITLVGYGTMVKTILDAADKVAAKGISAEVVKINCITPIELPVVAESCARTGRLIIVEDSVAMNSVGKRVIAGLVDLGVYPKIAVLQNLGNGFVTHGSVSQLRKQYGLDIDSICLKIEEVCARG